MTVTQLKIVLLTAREGSISAAARELDMPQPNASNGIRSLEKELGFEIFKRYRGGISLTEKGQLFLYHARRILEENDQINKLSEVSQVFQLRVGCTNYFRGKEAFIRLCREHQEDEITNLQYHNVSVSSGMAYLHDHQLDVVIGLIVDSLLPTVTEMATEKRLVCRELGDGTPVIRLRKDHPIVKAGLFDRENIDVNVLLDYPYVGYQNLNTDFDTPFYKAVFKVPCKFAMCVDEKDTRCRLVQETNAFSLGDALPQETLDHYGLVEYVYPGYHLKMIALCRKEDSETPEIRHFIQLAREAGG